MQSELNRGTNGETENIPKTRHFFCRMNVSRNARRQMRFGDQKVSLFITLYIHWKKCQFSSDLILQVSLNVCLITLLNFMFLKTVKYIDAKKDFTVTYF